MNETEINARIYLKDRNIFQVSYARAAETWKIYPSGKFLKYITLFLFFLSVTSKNVNAQEPDDFRKGVLYGSGEFGLGASGLYIEYKDFAVRTGFGLNLHYSVNENVMLNWHLYFGKSYFSTSVWVPLGPLLFSASVLNGNINRSALGLLLLSALPDGVSFPLRITDKFFITPTINPLNLDMFGKDTQYKRFYINGNIGLGFHIKGKFFNIHPFGAWNLLYTRGSYTGFSGGIEIELRLSEM